MIQRSALALALLLVCNLYLSCLSSASADDWPRFRGPSGSGVAGEAEGLPTGWSPTANLAWKTEMPGPGASSPIIIGKKAFVTCYSGYGLSKEDPGDLENLMRHLVCIDTETGSKLWQQDVKAAMPEDTYTGIGVTAHGYASHTPVSDGTNIYAFFGKSGVHAYDLDGKKLWNAEVGKESDPTKWGSSSSPIVYKNIVIITASAESQSIIGLDKETGKELWRQEAKGLDGMWGTPTLVKVDDNRTDLVMCVAKELWGLNPNNGELRWFAGATDAQHAYASVVLDGKRVFAFTGRGGGSIAVDAGGSGDVSESNTAWTGRDNSGFASPVRHGSKIYVVANGILTVVEAESGKRAQQLRLKGVQSAGGRGRSLDYASPIIVGDTLFSLNGNGQMFVFDLSGEEAKQVAINRLTAEEEVFWGTPAVSNGRMFVRSAKNLYCVMDKGDKVDPAAEMLAQADEPEAEQGGGPGGRPGGAGGPGRGGRPGGGGRGAGGGGGEDRAASMFAGMDTNKDDKLTEDELEGNPMADRLMTLDKDDDDAISKEEFANIGSLFSRGGGGGGGGGYRGGGKDTRPDRPQRPKSASGT